MIGLFNLINTKKPAPSASIAKQRLKSVINQDFEELQPLWISVFNAISQHVSIKPEDLEVTFNKEYSNNKEKFIALSVKFPQSQPK